MTWVKDGAAAGAGASSGASYAAPAGLSERVRQELPGDPITQVRGAAASFVTAFAAQQ